MFFDSNNTKEAIKTRMLRIALTYWETKNTDELDPLVKLLMEALSAELYDVINDIRNAEGRILEKMAHLLAPDLLTSPSPAHAVLQALPGEPSEKLTTDDQFYLEKKIASKKDGPLDTSVDIYFAAVNRVRIFDAQVLQIFTGTNLYSIDPGGSKLLTANVQNSGQANECCLWIGMEINTRLTELNGMSFYFDLKNIETAVADFVYQNLPFSRWYINGQETEVEAGLPDEISSGENESDKDISNADLLSSIRKNLNAYYDRKFMTIQDSKSAVNEESLITYPGIFKGLFTEAVLQKLTKKLLWVKIVFPTSIQQELLNEINVKANAFPVMNCRRNEIRYRLRSGRNIIPIPNAQNESFVTVKSLSDGVTQYKSIPFRKAGDENVGTFTLRTGGLERFDSRNGKEMINYLLELLRSESAAFSAFGQDFIASTLKEMNQFIALMEQKTNATIKDANEIPSYIIVKPIENRELMYLEYWTTNTELANNIRSGTRLQQGRGVSVKPDSVMLLTPAVGGKDKLKSEEKLYAFKYGLMTRDRIVTVEDIRNFCFYELGNKLGKVTVRKGLEISDNPKEGIKRTIDVALTPAQAAQGNDWQLVCEQMKSKLQSRSGISNNYRVFSN